MHRKEKPRSLWDRGLSFPQSFSYEGNAPLKTVVHELATLEEEAQFFQGGERDMSILPVGDHYVFRLRHRRHGTLTVSAEGEVWQDENGCVIIEGEARINASGAILSLVLISLIGIVTVMTMVPVVSRLIMLVPFTLSMLMGIATFFMVYRRDRQQLMARMEDAVTHLNSTTEKVNTKEKRYPALELDETDTQHEDESEAHSHAQEKQR